MQTSNSTQAQVAVATRVAPAQPLPLDLAALRQVAGGTLGTPRGGW